MGLPTIRRIGLLILVVIGVAASANAEQTAGKAVDGVRRGLSPADLEGVRAVGRSVLAAKRNVVDDKSDSERVTRLRAAIDRLLAAELSPKNLEPITLQGTEDADQRKSRSEIAKQRADARADARALAAEMRGRGHRAGSGGPAADAKSGGFSVEQQRARLFQRWADKLDEALAEGNRDRVPQLLALHRQLQPGGAGFVDPSRRDVTPTLQAMPSGYGAPDQQ